MCALKSSPENTSSGPTNAKPNIKNPNKPTNVFFINSVLLSDFKYNLIEREYINDNELFIEIFQDNRVNIMKNTNKLKT